MSAIQYVILSPHLDDAVLSCGGMIYQLVQAGQPVRVITMFAGDPPPGALSPFAQSLHERWDATPAHRRDEDRSALQLLGAEAVAWPTPEAIYRRDSGGPWYASEESIFGEVAEADSGLVASLAQRLAHIELSARLVVPLAAGHHVDHQLVRATAESLGRVLVYYEDYPYAETPDELEAVLRAGAWLAETVRLSDESIRTKAKAINAYRSQISTFFEDAAEVEQRVRAYARQVGGEAGPAERLWRPASPLR